LTPGRTEHYTIKEGYSLIIKKFIHPLKKKIWKGIWDNDVIPKINYFYWGLTHEKILKIENLRIKNIKGLLWCMLCKANEQSIPHLFLSCCFTFEVWRLAFEKVCNVISIPRNWEEMLETWK